MVLCTHHNCTAQRRFHKNGTVGLYCSKHECHATGCTEHRMGHETFVDQRGHKTKQCSNYCSRHRCDYLFGMSGGVRCELGIRENGHFH